MKKFLCVALFCFAIVANATEKKENMANNSNEVKVEKSTSEKVEEDIALSDELVVGCGSEGNDLYDTLRVLGLSHRDARSVRRSYVRGYRGFGPGGWIGDWLGSIGFPE